MVKFQSPTHSFRKKSISIAFTLTTSLFLEVTSKGERLLKSKIYFYKLEKLKEVRHKCATILNGRLSWRWEVGMEKRESISLWQIPRFFTTFNYSFCTLFKRPDTFPHLFQQNRLRREEGRRGGGGEGGYYRRNISYIKGILGLP